MNWESQDLSHNVCRRDQTQVVRFGSISAISLAWKKILFNLWFSIFWNIYSESELLGSIILCPSFKRTICLPIWSQNLILNLKEYGVSNVSRVSLKLGIFCMLSIVTLLTGRQQHWSYLHFLKLMSDVEQLSFCLRLWSLSSFVKHLRNSSVIEWGGHRYCLLVWK